MSTLKQKLAQLQQPPDTVVVCSGEENLTVDGLLETVIAFETPVDPSSTIAICFQSTARLVKSLFALDGHYASLLLISPDLPREEILTLLQSASPAALISDVKQLADISDRFKFAFRAATTKAATETMWLLTTSGTMGVPKIVPHTLDNLTASVRRRTSDERQIWGMLYEGSRFAGLQVNFQALLNGGTLIAPRRDVEFSTQIETLAAAGCTHLSATPTLWRKVLMSPVGQHLNLRQVTLGGEIADERLLTALASRFRDAQITQIYASTELGVGFSVHDGKAGFPLNYVQSNRGSSKFKIKDGVLWAKPQSAPRADHLVRDQQGFICTGDLVESVGDRLLFRGRSDAVANIGGIKVELPLIEHEVRKHAEVLDCQVFIKPSSISGAVLGLRVVPRGSVVDLRRFKVDVQSWCRDRLPRVAWPAMTLVVSELGNNASGKLSLRL